MGIYLTEVIANSLIALVLVVSAIARQGMSPTTAARVASGHVHAPQVVADSAGIVHLIWSDIDVGSGRTKIFYSRSTDQGAHFSSPILIASNNPTQPFLAVANDGTVFVLWVAAEQREIMLATSRDGLSFWGPVGVAVGDSPSADIDRSGVLYVVWDIWVKNHFEIRTASSKNGGKTFSRPITITTEAQGFRSPALAVDERGALLVAWEGRGISISRSENGRAFTTITLPRGIAAEDHLPSAKVSGRVINAEDHLPNIKAGRRGQVYVTWEALAHKQYAIMFSRSEDDGKTFSPPVKIFSSSVAAWDPKLEVAADGTIPLVWSSSLGPVLYEQYISFSHSSDEGRTFSQPTSLSACAFSFHPSVTVDSAGKYFFVWECWKSASDPNAGSDLLLVSEPTSSMIRDGISH